MSKDKWWAPKQIEFTWEQVEWLLSHYPLLQAGQWPKEDREDNIAPTGVVPKVHGVRRRHWAYFETPCEVAAELDIRMQLIGGDSSILRDIYILGLTEEKAAKMRGLSDSKLHRLKVDAMKMMCGRDHKGPRCEDCRHWEGHCGMWSVECMNSLLRPSFKPREGSENQGNGS